MSFPRARTKRFNDIVSDAPSPTAYDPKVDTASTGPASFFKDARFKVKDCSRGSTSSLNNVRGALKFKELATASTPRKTLGTDFQKNGRKSILVRGGKSAVCGCGGKTVTDSCDVEWREKVVQASAAVEESQALAHANEALAQRIKETLEETRAQLLHARGEADTAKQRADASERALVAAVDSPSSASLVIEALKEQLTAAQAARELAHRQAEDAQSTVENLQGLLDAERSRSGRELYALRAKLAVTARTSEVADEATVKSSEDCTRTLQDYREALEEENDELKAEARRMATELQCCAEAMRDIKGELFASDDCLRQAEEQIKSLACDNVAHCNKMADMQKKYDVANGAIAAMTEKCNGLMECLALADQKQAEVKEHWKRSEALLVTATAAQLSKDEACKLTVLQLTAEAARVKQESNEQVSLLLGQAEIAARCMNDLERKVAKEADAGSRRVAELQRELAVLEERSYLAAKAREAVMERLLADTAAERDTSACRAESAEARASNAEFALAKVHDAASQRERETALEVAQKLEVLRLERDSLEKVVMAERERCDISQADATTATLRASQLEGDLEVLRREHGEMRRDELRLLETSSRLEAELAGATASLMASSACADSMRLELDDTLRQCSHLVAEHDRDVSSSKACIDNLQHEREHLSALLETQNVSLIKALAEHEATAQRVKVAEERLASAVLEVTELQCRVDSLRIEVSVAFESGRCAASNEESEAKLRKLLEEEEQYSRELESKLDYTERKLSSMKTDYERQVSAAQDGKDALAIDANYWKQLYVELHAKVEPFQEQLDAYESERKALVSRSQNWAEEVSALSGAYARLLGHQNQRQKIQHVVKIKDENRALKTELETLREEKDKLRRAVAARDEKIRVFEGHKKFDRSMAFKTANDIDIVTASFKTPLKDSSNNCASAHKP